MHGGNSIHQQSLHLWNIVMKAWTSCNAAMLATRLPVLLNFKGQHRLLRASKVPFFNLPLHGSSLWKLSNYTLMPEGVLQESLWGKGGCCC